MFDRKKQSPDICGGVVTDKILEGYNEKIESQDITLFQYDNGDFHLKANLEDNKLHIEARGGNGRERDGTYFKLDYITDDTKLMQELNKIIVENEISKNNGYAHEVAGLPAGLGDTITVEYLSGEKIFKYSNQFPTVPEEVGLKFYEAFHKNALENDYDFTTEGSNVIVYDDPTEEYLQGAWNGTHFGTKIRVEFSSNNIKIYCDDKLTDDTEYTIVCGNIRPNKVKENVTDVKNQYDYEEFNGCSSLGKKNEILLVAYFTKESYSTCELLRENNK